MSVDAKKMLTTFAMIGALIDLPLDIDGMIKRQIFTPSKKTTGKGLKMMRRLRGRLMEKCPNCNCQRYSLCGCKRKGDK